MEHRRKTWTHVNNGKCQRQCVSQRRTSIGEKNFSCYDMLSHFFAALHTNARNAYVRSTHVKQAAAQHTTWITGTRTSYFHATSTSFQTHELLFFAIMTFEMHFNTNHSLQKDSSLSGAAQLEIIKISNEASLRIRRGGTDQKYSLQAFEANRFKINRDVVCQARVSKTKDFSENCYRFECFIQ